MKFETAITHITESGEEYIRGKKLTTVMQEHTFTEAIALILFGYLPSEKEKKMLDAILTAEIDHGPGTASAMGARISASAKNSVHTALAAGILCMGERHGIAVEAVMSLLYSIEDKEHAASMLAVMKQDKKYVPGLGHKVFTTEDPRATMLFSVAKDVGIFGVHCEHLQYIHSKVNEVASKPLPINIDGAIGAILCDMNIDQKLGQGIFLIGRIPGLIAHIKEEQEHDVGIRRTETSNIVYTGILEEKREKE